VKKKNAPNVDPLELFVTLVAGAENLSVNAARALLRLRRAQLAARDGAKGALLKLELRDEKLDLLATVGKSQLLPDVFKLMVLELMESFPARTGQLRRLLRGGPIGPDLRLVAPGCEERIFDQDDVAASILWASAKPILESLAAGLLRHRKSPLPKSNNCPLCGGRAYGKQRRKLLCGLCETRWQGDEKAQSIEADLEAFHAQPLVELVRNLEQSPEPAA
jgi:hypothetical protein